MLVNRDLGGSVKELSAAELATAKGDARGSLVQSLGGAVLVVGAVAAIGQLMISRSQLETTRERDRNELELAQKAQASESFTRAVDQLGSKELDRRMGGIIGLGFIAKDSEAHRGSVVDLLCTWAREHAPPPLEPGADFYSAENGLRRRAPALQCLLDVLKEIPGPLGPRVRLYDTWLERADIREVKWERADLRFAHLKGSFLTRADLRNALLEDADLSGTYLYDVDLTGANVTGATFAGARANSRTKWPESINPSDEGVTVKDE